jgi:hypothetical protein
LAVETFLRIITPPSDDAGSIPVTEVLNTLKFVISGNPTSGNAWNKHKDAIALPFV